MDKNDTISPVGADTGADMDANVGHASLGSMQTSKEADLPEERQWWCYISVSGQNKLGRELILLAVMKQYAVNSKWL